MKKLFVCLIWMLLVSSAAFGASASEPGTALEDASEALTLSECYTLALKQSEFIAVDAEKIKEAEAHFLQSLGTILPQVSFARTQIRKDFQSSSVHNKYEQKFVFQQALFSGFKEFAAISANRYEKKQAISEKARAEQLLFTDVSDAFYLLLEVRGDLSALETIRQTFSDRVDELKSRENLGKSRTSEAVSTETQLYVLEDQIESGKAEEIVSRQLLEFLVGRPVKEITDTSSQFVLKPESGYLSNADSRNDVLAAKYAWLSAQKNVAFARSGFFPSVNLESDYYTHLATAPSDARWDAVLKISVPLWEGTSNFGLVKEANAKAREGELLFKRAGRLANQDIHNAYINAQYAFSRLAILEKALKSAELNYTLQINDYEKNVVNNLDVLTAIQNLANVRRSYNSVLYTSKRYYLQLQVAAGEIPVER
ncbi:MAG: TolC family protein [Candidatus Omnitrophica bacterium]|nr:TolC family protein [Candidatus Omnitrophota bacterium]